MSCKLRSLAKLLGIAVAAASVSVSVSVMAADHAESPGVNTDLAADIADVYLFPSPEAPTTKMVGAITFGGGPAVTGATGRNDTAFSCDPNVLYTFNIDRSNADGNFDQAVVADIQIYARTATNSAGACGLQLENVPGANGTFSGPVGQVFTSPGGTKGFAGLRNDPFFFDFEGFTALLNSFAAPGQSGNVITAFRLSPPGQARRDSFANRNVSAIVFEMNLDTLAPPVAGTGTRPKIRVWGTTARLAQ